MVQINGLLDKSNRESITVVTVNMGHSHVIHDDALHDAFLNNTRPPEIYKSHQWVVFYDRSDGFVQYSANDTRDMLFSEQ